MILTEPSKKLILPDPETYVEKQFELGLVAHIKLNALTQYREDLFDGDHARCQTFIVEFCKRRNWHLKPFDYGAGLEIIQNVELSAAQRADE